MKIRQVGRDDTVFVLSEYEPFVIKWIALRRTMHAAQQLMIDELLEVSSFNKIVAEFASLSEFILNANITDNVYQSWSIVNEN
jgi:hypothetical protein